LTNASDHANAMCELYRTTRPSATQLEALLAVSTDGTGAQACDFDPCVTMPDFTKLSRDEAWRLLSAGYTVQQLLPHPLETSRCFPGASTERAWRLSRIRGALHCWLRRRERRPATIAHKLAHNA